MWTGFNLAGILFYTLYLLAYGKIRSDSSLKGEQFAILFFSCHKACKKKVLEIENALRKVK